MGSRYLISPPGAFIHPWINKADTKYNEDGIYHTKLDMPVDVAKPIMEKIEGRARAALAEQTDTMTAGQARQWNIHLPFEEVLDDETGEPTGIIRFTFKQNAVIRTKDDGVKNVTLEVRDADDKPVDTTIWSGDEGRVMFTMRDITMSSLKKAGVRLDFAKVQIIKKAKSSVSDAGFEKVEGGFVAGGNSNDDDHEGDPEVGDY